MIPEIIEEEKTIFCFHPNQRFKDKQCQTDTIVNDKQCQSDSLERSILLTFLSDREIFTIVARKYSGLLYSFLNVE
jgi:hypothetical protein